MVILSINSGRRIGYTDFSKTSEVEVLVSLTARTAPGRLSKNGQLYSFSGRGYGLECGNGWSSNGIRRPDGHSHISQTGDGGVCHNSRRINEQLL